MNKNVMELFAGLEEKVEEIIESNTKKEVLEQAEMWERDFKRVAEFALKAHTLYKDLLDVMIPGFKECYEEEWERIECDNGAGDLAFEDMTDMEKLICAFSTGYMPFADTDDMGSCEETEMWEDTINKIAATLTKKNAP